jgi:hypothetical protein
LLWASRRILLVLCEMSCRLPCNSPVKMRNYSQLKLALVALAAVPCGESARPSTLTFSIWVRDVLARQTSFACHLYSVARDGMTHAGNSRTALIISKDDLNPIACESCRSKKCKCDRKLFVLTQTSPLYIADSHSPSCSQCQSSPGLCRYQEGGKRGLPAAYMIRLESRLRDTENALYASLRTLWKESNQSSPSLHLMVADLMVPRSQPSKAEKQREWEQSPLRTGEDIVAWFEQREKHCGGSDSKHAVSTDKGRSNDEVVSAPGIDDMLSTTPIHCDVGPHEDVIEQLRNCRQPAAPNVSPSVPSSHIWCDNYF